MKQPAAMEGMERFQVPPARAVARSLPTLRGRLITLVAVIALPLCLLVGLSAWLVQRAASEQSREALIGQARAIAAAVDAEFAQATAILRTLATSEALARGDLTVVEREMRAIAAAHGTTLGLHDTTGRFLLTTSWPEGERRDARSASPAIRQAWEGAQPVISNLLASSQAGGATVFGVALPVTPAGAPAYVLTINVPRDRMRAIVAQPPLRGSGFAAILDRDLRLVARSGDDDALVGMPAREPLSNAVRAAPEGTMPGAMVNVDGVQVVAGFSRAPVSGYLATASITEEAFGRPLREALTRVVPIGLLVVAGGVVAALALGSRLTGAFRALAALGRGEQPATPGLREVDDAARALTREAEDRRIAQQRQALLMGELNHRVKNVLASVQSVAVQTLRGAGGDPARFAEDFNGRLRSLAAAHDLLTERAWAGADVAAVIEAALAPWRDDPRLRLSGTDRVLLTPPQAQSLVLALNELATNACKHGAMSVPGGVVTVSHAMADDGTATLTWAERGGPPVPVQPQRRGFGLRLLERGLAADLGRDATVALDFAPEGLTATVRFTPAG